MGRGEDSKDEESIPIQYRDHAWFVAYAPQENPSIAVAVLIQHGGHGGSVAAPVARTIIEATIPQDPGIRRVAFEGRHDENRSH